MTRPVKDSSDEIARDSPVALTRRASREAAEQAARRSSRSLRRASASRATERTPKLHARPVVTLTLLGLFAGVGTGAAASEPGLAGLAAVVRGSVGGPAGDAGVQAAAAEPRAPRAASRGTTRDVLEVEPSAAEESVVAPAPVEPSLEELAAAQAAVDAAAALVAAQQPPPGVSEEDFLAGILSAQTVHKGDGTFTVVPGEVPAPGTGKVKTIRIQVENGLEVDGEKFAALVLATLNDPRSWGGDGSQTFARTASSDATLTVSLASPDLVDDLCAPLDTEGLWSCGIERHAVLNSMRWAEGSGIYGADRVAYRQYLVNHEVGHVLGYKHVTCTGRKDRADIMVQQSGDSLSCVPNGWPFP